MNDTPEVPNGTNSHELREGEILFDRKGLVDGPQRLRPIGRVRSVWNERGRCPKNMRQAREAGDLASLEIDPPFRAALNGLEAGQWVFLLTWLDQARRDLARQQPRHAPHPRGTFSLRSPVRPNPIGLHLVRLLHLETETGIVGIDAIDVLDATPLLDIKPYLPSVDAPPPGAD